MGINTSNMIFVFDSNLAGIHGAGAAAFAAQQRGAKYGASVGRTGQCYAIPTKGIKQVRCDNNMHLRTVVGAPLQLHTIRIFVDEFIAYAMQHPEYQFQITAIGCGLAGFKHEEMAKLFVEAPKNCWFDTAWRPYLGSNANFWGSF